MTTDIVMPQLGESIAEGTIVKWLVPVGGPIKKDEALLEVETDKVALDIPAPASGSLAEIFIQEGETVPVGTLLARVADSAETGNGSHAPTENTAPTQTREAHGQTQEREEAVSLSPAVRDLAGQYHVDVRQISGTGANGRITKKDVMEYIHRQGLQNKHRESSTARPQSDPPDEELMPISSMRRTIAERMVMSRKTSAHVATFFEVDFTSVEKVRPHLQLTYLPFVIKAVTTALAEVPVLNASWTEKGLVIKHHIHMGVAVAMEEGLLVPVIHDAALKDLSQLGKEIADLSARARTKQLRPEEVQGGTFTITNHGSTGSLFSTPIINQPQVAILGVGAIQPRPVVVNDHITVGLMGYLSLSFDHRVIDGATADHFMKKVKGMLEQHAWENER